MTRFQRLSALVVGIGLFAVYVGGVVYVGLDAVPTTTSVGVVISLLAASAYVLTGVRERTRVRGRSVSWHQTMGVGTILLALGWFFVSLPLVTSRPILGVAILAGTGVLLFAGYEELTDGEHVDLETEPSRMGLVAVAALVALAIGIGVALFTSSP
ncbi:hypothetical protein [Natronobiforma cellulositropha]|uniref:hypothetical protein n=1 Tax=Natronobiforma cellulositropha TaxID=1679076 RepID=UPI0021D60F35|nr:hypothetical protein [Natronobiforma cellulositropha]